MCDLCNDNRFELIEKYKKELIEATNIETAPDEMAVLDNILFRFWQMGWLDKLELPSAHPEPHTVILNKDKPGGIWWILTDDTSDILCVICVVRRKNEVHFARTFTPVEHRNKGNCTALLRYLSTVVYPADKLTAHCLPASVGCYTRSGFELCDVKEFKHGKQYYMLRKGKI